jgi:hypothetical protein
MEAASTGVHAYTDESIKVVGPTLLGHLPVCQIATADFVTLYGSGTHGRTDLPRGDLRRSEEQANGLKSWSKTGGTGS